MRRALPAVLLLLGGLTATAALAGPDSRSATANGMTLTVDDAVALPDAGVTVRVTGQGYDTSKGIYVAFCVDTGVGNKATPCGGGADTEGSSGNSVWISSFPPDYGTGLAQPYGEGGTFDVTIRVAAMLDETTDCRRVRCAVVTRTDHTRSEDRSMDVRVPVTFAGAARPAQATPGRPTAVVGSPSPRATTVQAPRVAAAAAPPTVPATSPAAGSPAAASEVPLALGSESLEEGVEPRPEGGSPLGALLAGLAGLGAAAGAVAWLRRRRTP